MKKVVTFVLALSIILTLTSCDLLSYTIRKDSLEDYVDDDGRIHYHSTCEIDSPDYFLPSLTFITDYANIYGEYHYYEECGLGPYPRSRPDTCILILRYDSQVYSGAKSYMIEQIPAYNDIRYIYRDYIFYENANDVNLRHGNRTIPNHFTMACYNDTKQELVFIGFADSARIDQKYYDDLEGNWVSFIDTYYGEYYDFSE